MGNTKAMKEGKFYLEISYCHYNHRGSDKPLILRPIELVRYPYYKCLIIEGGEFHFLNLTEVHREDHDVNMLPIIYFKIDDKLIMIQE